MQLDECFRCELTSLVWLLSLATAGNLLAISSDQTIVYARSLVKVWICCMWHIHPASAPLPL